ncbi:MAG TPA: zf-HC2 domain-containing protein [Longimicrobium sp.]|nr:zf-HC2 domain-containing protein [Longimicrobium sp.]
MSHEETIELLDDYVSGELPEGERAEVEAHLHECGACREEAAALTALLAEAAALPRGIAPPRDLWAGIEARISPAAATQPAGEDDFKVIPFRPRPRWRPPQWVTAMAASVVLVVGSSLATMRFMGPRTPDGPAATLPQVVAAPPAQAGTPTAFAAFSPAEADYRQAIAELQAVLDARRAQLAPETVRTLEANLAIIDQAIRESRAALAADPDSRELTQMLSSVYDTKVQMLQKAVEL